ncbi:MAG: hypothetical protein AAGJ80_07105 [Cyanobacteria bacterium J06553_1]
MDVTISIQTRKIALRLSYFAIGFLLAGVVSHSIKYDVNALPDLYRWFGTDGEKNLPAAFSCGLLLVASTLLGVITVNKRENCDRFTLHWGSLSLIFSLLALDEWMSFHERLTDVVKTVVPAVGIFHFAWIIIGMAFSLLIGLLYRQFLKQLPHPYRRLFLIAAGLFLLGAIGMEMLSGHYVENHQQWNRNSWLALTTIEEGLEMFGMIVFIHTLLRYISTFIGHHFQVRLVSPMAAPTSSMENDL